MSKHLTSIKCYIIVSTQSLCFRVIFTEKKRSSAHLRNSLIINVAGVGHDPTTSGL